MSGKRRERRGGSERAGDGSAPKRERERERGRERGGEREGGMYSVKENELNIKINGRRERDKERETAPSMTSVSVQDVRALLSQSPADS